MAEKTGIRVITPLKYMLRFTMLQRYYFPAYDSLKTLDFTICHICYDFDQISLFRYDFTQ